MKILDSSVIAAILGTEKIPVSPDGHITPDMLKSFVFPFQMFFGNITQLNYVDAGVPTIVEVYNNILKTPGVTMSWGISKQADGEYKFTPDIAFNVDKIIYGLLPNYIAVSAITNADMFNMKFNTGDSTFAFQSGDLSSGLTDNKFYKTTFFILRFP